MSEARTSSRTRHIRILDVDYEHRLLPNGSELFLSSDGLPLAGHLQPDFIWGDSAWLTKHAVRLSGTSNVFKIHLHDDLNIVLKWNRMGLDIPGETHLLAGSEGVTFNSPFEEFSLVYELSRSTLPAKGVFIQQPLAIYVPSEIAQAWELGRDRSKISPHAEIDIQFNKSYAVIYRWIEGLDLAEAEAGGLISAETKSQETLRMDEQLRDAGFRVADWKPQHVIIDPRRDEKAHFRGIIDFELLKRTGNYARARKESRREEYLKRMANRMTDHPDPLPENLHAVEILGVPYIYGQMEGLGSALWVVGRDWKLFEYFRPEKWRKTDKLRFSSGSMAFYTTTEDNIKIVWKTSKVGGMPSLDYATHSAAIAYGYNSPFEEFAFAMQLLECGVPVIYPRAIYRSESRTKIHELLADDSRYESHRRLYMPDGDPALRRDHNYTTLWGYWNGPDNQLSLADRNHLFPINANLAFKNHYIRGSELNALLTSESTRLQTAGFTDLNAKGSHLLISLSENNEVLRDEDGSTLLRYCNLELMKKTEKAPEELP